MTKIKKEIEIFISEDGKEFGTEHQCITYEKEKAFADKRKAFLAEVISNLIKDENIKVEIFSLASCKESISGTNTKLYYKHKDTFYEFDENFWLEDSFDDIVDEVSLKYGFEISIPYYYYSK